MCPPTSVTSLASRSGVAYDREAVVDLDAVAHSAEALKQAVGTELMAVVKAHAYGHGDQQGGTARVGRAALDGGATMLGVAHLAEALELRRSGKGLLPTDVPLIAWLHSPRIDFTPALEHDIRLGVSSVAELDAVVQAARRAGKRAVVHLKADTGLGRNGAMPDTFRQLVDTALAARNHVELEGIMSHLAVADEPDRPETAEQLARFHELLQVADDVDWRYRHLANTPGLLAHPGTRLDLARAGLGIYGLNPFQPGTQHHADVAKLLRPAMTFRARVAQVKRVPAGQGVSYGLTYRTQEPSTLALIPVGYADGVPRASQGGPVRIGERTYPVVGRVAMDQVVVDLGPDTQVRQGDWAILFGQDGPTADHWARAAGTINYEIVTRIGPRVPRVYEGGRA